MTAPRGTGAGAPGRLALLLALALGTGAEAARAQVQADTATVRVLRAVADGVLRDATFDFVDSASGRHFAVPDSAPARARLRLASAYNDWRYWNGVLNLAMFRLTGVLEDARYFSFARRNILFAFDHSPWFARRYAGEDRWTYPFAHHFGMVELDDFGVEGSNTAGVLIFQPDDRLKAYVERAASYIATGQVRLPDGTVARDRPRRFTVWADDLFMSVPFLLSLYGRTGDPRWLEDATRQVVNFHRYLFDQRAGLMRHNWYSDSTGGADAGAGAAPGVAFWGRANGWALMAEVELLDRFSPRSHGARDTVLALFRRHVEGLARYQDTSGLWHQLLDRADSYLETSASAMFAYAIAHGVRQGYLPASYAATARRAWQGVMTRVRPDGQIEGTCAGTGVSDNLADYYARPTPLNDVHGVGPVLLAGEEILQLGR